MRPSLDAYFMAHAALAATRSTCLRRAVGAAIVDGDGVLLSTGYNGVPRRVPHCGAEESACGGLGHASGHGLDACQAIHAEQNAIVFCRDLRSAKTIYVTTAPCVSCVKLLLNTPIERIVYGVEYAGGGGDLWLLAGRRWEPSPRQDAMEALLAASSIGL